MCGIVAMFSEGGAVRPEALEKILGLDGFSVGRSVDL